MDRRGRSCPLAYRYQPEALAEPAQLSADTLYVVGGLYGNLVALRAALERAGHEPGGPAAVVFMVLSGRAYVPGVQLPAAGARRNRR